MSGRLEADLPPNPFVPSEVSWESHRKNNTNNLCLANRRPHS